ncbi:MAG: diadenylate cyclase CdaA [Clostridiales Family XIII bacterium]|jgi:diadenylate cyclase|nr:diadenylate cyclase CdaA [Clostridiales Family XIII bacterium]
MAEFFNLIASNFGIRDVVDVAIIYYVLYKALGFIRETRAEQLIRGLLLLLLAAFASGFFKLYALNWMLIGAMQFGVVALVVVFQPELRRGLEYMGRSKFLRPQFGGEDKEAVKAAAKAVTKAIDDLSSAKTGALIVMERETTLTDITESGVVLNADISAELLKNIFYKGAPLHDGAVLIRNTRVQAAGCVLPLTQNTSLSMDLGTRHRASIGITEHSDALALVVSEETGVISMASDGKLTRFLDIKTVEKSLLNMYLSDFGDKSQFSLLDFFKRDRNAKK